MAETAAEIQSPSDKVITIRCPATLEEAGNVTVHSREQVAQQVALAREAQAVWGSLSFSQRAKMLRRFRDFVVDAKDEIADTVVSETGKPRAEVYGNELVYLCDGIGYWAKNAGRLLADRQVAPHLLKNKKAYTTYKPRGVIGMITPWNFPLSLTIGEAVPALAAGNAVVIKPSEVTPLTALLGCRLAEESGLPPNLLSAVVGYGETGSDLVDFVDMVSFTGSVATGRKIQVKCGEQLKPTTMELGGKDPMVVCADANVERAANGCVWGGIMNAGQVCISIERVYVVEKIYDDFVDRVVKKVGELRQGAPYEESDVGSMIFPPQLDKVERQVEAAKAAGARVLAGGKKIVGRAGYWYEPTVLVDVNHDMEIMSEETFGPVIAIQKVSDDAEAVKLANDSRYGLSASVWSRDKAGAMNIARRIEAGAVCVNDHMIHMLIPEVPMGGIKESGLGRRHGEEGIRKYCDQQTIIVDRFGANKELVWYPTPRGMSKVLRRTLNLLFRSGWRNKLKG
ncbi:MAG: succinic semialdehyde dehydrogenase [Candidatus Binatia bacterium]